MCDTSYCFTQSLILLSNTSLSLSLSLSNTYILRTYITDLDSISVISERYSDWFRSPVDDVTIRPYGMSKSMDAMIKDPDNDSLFTVTTSSDVYQDRGLDVDLNEKFYMKSVRPASK